jgi:hypothetical protein
VTWTLPFTLKGNYELFAVYQERKISCEVCKLRLKPTTFNFDTSSMMYYNPWVMYNVDWNITEEIYELNLKMQPLYTFIPKDIYSNVITEGEGLPATLQSDLKAYILDGIDYKVEDDSIDYTVTVFEAEVTI